MKRIILIFATALLVVMSCNKVEFNDSQVTDPILLEASVETDLTKIGATVNEAESSVAYTWTKNDVISVQTPSGYLPYTLVGDGGSATGWFTGTVAPVGPVAFALHPAALGAAGGGNSVTFTLPSEYTFVEGQTNALMGAVIQTDTGKMYFKHLSGLIRVNVKEVPAGAKFVLTAAGKKINGQYYISNYVLPNPKIDVATTSVDSETKVTINFPTAVLDAFVYIPLPCGEYPSLKAELLASDNSVIKSVTSTTSKTIARATLKQLPAFTEFKGISTAEDLVQFAAAVNAGESLADWTNVLGKVVLLNDIDMSGVTSWTPIGASVFTWASNALTCKSGNMFTGHFDGQGYKIKNLQLSCTNSVAGTAWGLFGGLGSGAVVENIVFDSTCSLALQSTAATDCGILAGMVWDAKIKNITNNASMTFSGTSSARVTMAIVGMAFAEADSVVVKNVVNNANIVASDGGSNQNGAAGIQVAGILGFGTNHISSTNIVAVLNCTNNGNLTSATARTSGIVAAANRYTHIRDCKNYGHNTNSFNLKPEAAGQGARIGNLTCITGAGSAIYDSINYGDVISTTKGAVAGCICLVNHATNVFQNIRNYGRAITDRAQGVYCGVFFGYCNVAATFTNCMAGGSFGTYNGGVYELTELTAENYWTYVGQIGANATNATQDNIKFGTL